MKLYGGSSPWSMWNFWIILSIWLKCLTLDLPFIITFVLISYDRMTAPAMLMTRNIQEPAGMTEGHADFTAIKPRNSFCQCYGHLDSIFPNLTWDIEPRDCLAAVTRATAKAISYSSCACQIDGRLNSKTKIKVYICLSQRYLKRNHDDARTSCKDQKVVTYRVKRSHDGFSSACECQQTVDWALHVTKHCLGNTPMDSVLWHCHKGNGWLQWDVVLFPNIQYYGDGNLGYNVKVNYLYRWTCSRITETIYNRWCDYQHLVMHLVPNSSLGFSPHMMPLSKPPS